MRFIIHFPTFRRGNFDIIRIHIRFLEQVYNLEQVETLPRTLRRKDFSRVHYFYDYQDRGVKHIVSTSRRLC